VANHVADAIVAFWERADPSVREDALALADQGSLDRVADWLDNAMEALAEEQQENDWTGSRRTLPSPAGVEPWTRGYALARAARDTIGVDGGRIDFHKVGPLAIPWRETQPPSARIHGLVGTQTPACMTAPRGESGTRLIIARALGDYLGRSEPGHGLLSSLATDRQAQSRAFAAEFLAPADLLRLRIANDRVDVEQTDDLGQEFGISSELIRRQIENHQLARIVAY
jgi:hypothetical protein